MAKIGELDDATLLEFFIRLRDKRSQRKAAYDADDAGDERVLDGSFSRRITRQSSDALHSGGRTILLGSDTIRYSRVRDLG